MGKQEQEWDQIWRHFGSVPGIPLEARYFYLRGFHRQWLESESGDDYKKFYQEPPWVRGKTKKKRKKKTKKARGAKREFRRFAQRPTNEDVSALIEVVNTRLAEWRLETLAASTLGLPPADTADGHQVLIIRYYLDTDDENLATNVEESLDSVLDTCGFQSDFSYPIERGSFFRKIFYSSKDKLTPEEVAASLLKIERAAGVRALDVPQSQVDANIADGVAKLLTALAATPSAVVQIGSILLIKVDGTPIVKNLTPQELAELEREPHLFRLPNEVLNALQKTQQDSHGEDELPTA